MDAPTGPLRSPDGLWWWDGKAWQPIATLSVPPTAELAPGAPPLGGGWQPPPELAQQPTAAAEPPAPIAAQETQEVSSGAWQPPGAAPSPAPPPPAAPPPTAEWAPPPATPLPAAAPTAPAPVDAPPGPPPVFGPPQPPDPAPAAPGAPWPNWLPQNDRSRAVVADVPVRADPGAVKPPAPAAIRPAQIQVPTAAKSGWVQQLYPASAALNANRKLVTYAGLGILGLIALYVLYQVFANSGLFSLPGSTPTPDPGPTGTLFEQSDGYLTKSLEPALASVGGAEKPVKVDCGGGHSVTCRNTLENVDSALVAAIRVIDQGTFPGCISIAVAQTRHDLVIQEQAVRSALIGFRTNADDLVTKGLTDYAAASGPVALDGAALRAIEQTACPKTH